MISAGGVTAPQERPKEKGNQKIIGAEQQKEIKALKAGLKEQSSQIRKVSAHLILRHPAPQTAANHQ